MVVWCGGGLVSMGVRRHVREFFSAMVFQCGTGLACHRVHRPRLPLQVQVQGTQDTSTMSWSNIAMHVLNHAANPICR